MTVIPKAPQVARIPSNEPVLNTIGRPTMSWLYFFQTLSKASDDVIAADIPVLRAQIAQMLLDVADLQTHADANNVTNKRQNDELLLLVAPLPVPNVSVDILPEIQSPSIPVQDILPEIHSIYQPNPELLPDMPSVAVQTQLAQRLTDLENWSL